MTDAADPSRAAPVPAGWYGKLPSLGDFASRRLSADFIEAWDQWLASGLGAWQARSANWLDLYLAGPSWRFILMPGALPGPAGANAWAGVLMPSVDCVGRYFPLTLAQPISLATLPGDAQATACLLNALQQLDDIALDALQDDWSAETLEAALQDLAPGANADPALVDSVLNHLQSQAPGTVLWLCHDASGGTDLHSSAGLPQGEDFSALLSPTSPTSPASLAPPASPDLSPFFESEPHEH